MREYPNEEQPCRDPCVHTAAPSTIVPSLLHQPLFPQLALKYHRVGTLRDDMAGWRGGMTDAA